MFILCVSGKMCLQEMQTSLFLFFPLPPLPHTWDDAFGFLGRRPCSKMQTSVTGWRNWGSLDPTSYKGFLMYFARRKILQGPCPLFLSTILGFPCFFNNPLNDFNSSSVYTWNLNKLKPNSTKYKIMHTQKLALSYLNRQWNYTFHNFCMLCKNVWFHMKAPWQWYPKATFSKV